MSKGHGGGGRLHLPWRRSRPEAAGGLAPLPKGHSAGELVSEAEAFLSGRLVDRAELLCQPVPPWAWTNLLAHGAEEDLRRESTVDWSLREGRNSLHWHRARAYLAGEVVGCARALGCLRDVQTRVLVPLESELMTSPDTAKMKPAQWVALVEEALYARYHLDRPPLSGRGEG